MIESGEEGSIVSRKRSVCPRFSPERFRDYRMGTFPGRLYLYDVEAGRTFLITTNQADSEILLVENGIVYCRVSDRLYSAEVKEEGVGAPRLLAKAEVVRDAHWAFTSH